MKKILFASCILLFASSLFAKDYQIKEVEYNLNPSSWSFLPTTSEYALQNNVPVNKTKLFTTKEDLEIYIKDYTQRLENTRAFDSVQVEYVVSETKELNEVTLKVTTTDTVHLLAVPYPKYDSNTGAVLKLKAKDSNFLGTMNTMSADLNLSYNTENDENTFGLGINFSYDYPFKASIFNATWVNDYSIDYTFGKDVPEWSAKTGLKFELPKDRINYVLELYQSAAYNFDYKPYGDELYFNEYIGFSTPIKLFEVNNFGYITNTPKISFSYNWDFDGIDPVNSSLSSPTISLSDSISGSRINWHDNLRTGLSASITANIDFNIQRNMNYPSISTEFQAFKGFTLFDSVDFLNRIGICTDLYAFYYFTDKNNIYTSSDGSSIGSRLRGIKDTQYFEARPDLGASTTTPAAIVLNMDFPYHLFTTNFTKGFLRHFNFDLQISPFIDCALIYNKYTQQYFNPKDGFYAGGLEVLVYPKKWSSFVVRASLGIDIGRKFFGDYLNTDWRDDVSKKEISIGIGLHY